MCTDTVLDYKSIVLCSAEKSPACTVRRTGPLFEAMALRGMCYPLTSTAHLKIRYASPVPVTVAVQAEQCKTLKEA